MYILNLLLVDMRVLKLNMACTFFVQKLNLFLVDMRGENVKWSLKKLFKKSSEEEKSEKGRRKEGLVKKEQMNHPIIKVC